MNSIAKKIALTAGLGLLLATGGCFDTTEDFTINPDGSGKVVHECTFQPVDLNLGNNNQDPGVALTNAVREVLENCKGVEAWRDVTFKTLDDGRTYFKGTAYFKDLSKLDIPNQTMLEFDWKKTVDGNAVISLRTNKSTTPEGMSVDKPTSPAKDLSPEEFAKKLKKQRMEYQQSKPMLAGILGPMKHAVTLHLPGKVASSSNFGKDAGGNLTLKFEGAKLLEVMDKLVNDDDWCKQHGGTGMDGMQGTPLADEEMNRYIFGEKAPVQAMIGGDAMPLFDYATEVAMAKTAFAATRKELGVGLSSSGTPEAMATPAQGGIKSVKVAGVQLIMESDQTRELRPFNEDAGYTVSLLVEFPGSVLSVTDGSVLETATADDGTSLVPDSDFDRKVHFPKLAKDQTAALLEIKLNRPADGVKGLKELSGQVQYRVAGGTKELDLGLEELKAGAAGTELGARINSIGEGWQKNGTQVISLHVQADPADIKSLSLVVNGTKTELKQSSTSSSGDSSDLEYELNQALPAKGRLVAEVYDKVQVFNAPFKLENISLLGASLDDKK